MRRTCARKLGAIRISLPFGEPEEPAAPPPALPAGQAVEAEDADEAMSEAQHWLIYQYIVGGAEHAPKMLRAVMDEIDDPDKQDEAWSLLSLYAACLGTKHKDHLDGWVREAVTMSDDFKMLFAYASWYADFPGSAERLRPLIESFPEDHPYREQIGFALEQEPTDFATLPVTSPSAIDYLWACFLATGETRFVDRIMTVLPPKHQTLDDPEFGDIQEILLAGSARWSLSSNAFQHPRVLEHLRQRRASESDDWPELDGIIESAMKQLAERPSPAPATPGLESDERKPAEDPERGKDHP